MNDADGIRAVRTFFEGLFPRSCATCGRGFATLREYILTTTPLGPTIDYDIGNARANAGPQVGAIVAARCSCGGTVALTGVSMPAVLSRRLREWIKTETERRGSNSAEFLEFLRNRIRQEVLDAPT